MENKTLLKTDRNGTTYWRITESCPRCGGRGDYILGSLNYGVCFQCGGNGIHEYIYKEYTPEYTVKLEAARRKRQEKRDAEKRTLEAERAEEIEAQRQRIIESRYEENGCGKNGIGYVLSGDTYPIKEEIKKNGGRWIYGSWICPVEVTGKGVKSKRIDLNGKVGSGSAYWLNGFELWEVLAD